MMDCSKDFNEENSEPETLAMYLPIFNILGIGLLNSLLITNLSPVSQLVSFPSTLSLSLNIPWS
jgi:hypothetical protein